MGNTDHGSRLVGGLRSASLEASETRGKNRGKIDDRCARMRDDEEMDVGGANGAAVWR